MILLETVEESLVTRIALNFAGKLHADGCFKLESFDYLTSQSLAIDFGPLLL